MVMSYLQAPGGRVKSSAHTVADRSGGYREEDSSSCQQLPFSSMLMLCEGLSKECTSRERVLKSDVSNDSKKEVPEGERQYTMD